MCGGIVNKKRQKIFIFVIALITLGLLVFFFKDIIFNLLKYEKENNQEAINALLRDRGLLGAFIVVLVQALQMIVVFISAEFVQIAASISYPWYIALILCDLGVFVGASIIYFLVKLCKFDNEMFSNSANKINDIARRKKKNKGIQSFMYILFFMPIVPFGAICYYGASSKMSYKRYIFTCVSGVIPSILLSMLMGVALKEFISSGLSLWILVLIIIFGAALLLILFTYIIKKLYFVDGKDTPDSIYYSAFMSVFSFLIKRKSIATYNHGELLNIEGPYILLSNHGSFYDAYYLSNLAYPSRLAFILNRYYFKNKFANKILNRMGVIPKKLFTPDIETIRKTMSTIKKGYPILMCPEGRLSVDGTNYNITKETGKLLKALKVPVVIVRVNGAYLVKPKWRKNKIKGPVHTEVKHIIYKDELEELSVEEINDIINKNLSYNEFEYALTTNYNYNDKNKAEGLENILYYCPHCHKEYTISTSGNEVKCNDCGFSLQIQANYSFTDNEYKIKNIHDWYEVIKEKERKSIDQGFNLSCEVNVKKYNFKDDKLNEEGMGVCSLDNNEFVFKGKLNKEINFAIPVNKLRALAFSSGEEFECYYNDELYYFYPTYNKTQCCKWALIVDEINREVNENE